SAARSEREVGSAAAERGPDPAEGAVALRRTAGRGHDSGEESRLKRKPVQRRDSSFRTIATLTILPVAAFIAYFGWRWLSSDHVAPVLQPAPLAPAHPRTPPPEEAALIKPAPKPESRHHGSIVLILDDVGF